MFEDDYHNHLRVIGGGLSYSSKIIPLTPRERGKAGI
jgi:hypothetical protein